MLNDETVKLPGLLMRRKEVPTEGDQKLRTMEETGEAFLNRQTAVTKCWVQPAGIGGALVAYSRQERQGSREGLIGEP